MDVGVRKMYEYSIAKSLKELVEGGICKRGVKNYGLNTS